MGCWLRPPACGAGLGAPDRPRSRAIRQSTRPSRPAVRTGSQALQKGHRPLASVHVVIPPSRAPWHQSSNVMEVDPNYPLGKDFAMPLRRGEVLGYDFNRMVVDFTMLNQGKTVKCAISTAAMDNLEGKHDVKADQRVDQFVRLRDE